MRTRIRVVCVVVVLLAALRLSLSAQNFAPNAVLPLDAAIKTGALPNGLKYFIRKNGRPAKRVSLRLAVKAGSLDEADDQQGLAHLIEHMAFNGSAHFKPGELVHLLRIASARGSARTSTPTRASTKPSTCSICRPTSPKLSRKGLTALADFAGGLTLDPSRKSTRNAAWSSRSGAAASAPDRASATSRSRSSSTTRDTPIVCRSASPRSSATRRSARLRAFYDTWYRPERDGGRRRRRHRSGEASRESIKRRSARCKTARRRRRAPTGRCRCISSRWSASLPTRR